MNMILKIYIPMNNDMMSQSHSVPWVCKKSESLESNKVTKPQVHKAGLV